MLHVDKIDDLQNILSSPVSHRRRSESFSTDSTLISRSRSDVSRSMSASFSSFSTRTSDNVRPPSTTTGRERWPDVNTLPSITEAAGGRNMSQSQLFINRSQILANENHRTNNSQTP